MMNNDKPIDESNYDDFYVDTRIEDDVTGSGVVQSDEFWESGN